jgi:signal transduction histidine kinase
MEVINLAAAALFHSLDKHQVDRARLLDHTGLTLEHFNNQKKYHSWEQFTQMYENCALLIGEDQTAKEVGYHGIYNENISTLRKIGTGFFDAKSIYWYIASLVSKHLFKDGVVFKYKKISTNHVYMEIKIKPEMKDCPLLFMTYQYLFENIPTMLGLAKAKVEARISERRCEYNIHLVHSSFFKKVLSQYRHFLDAYKNSIVLMSELETKTIELSKLIEEKSQLVRILSHDITNQVTVIDFNLMKLEKNESLPEDCRRNLHIANNSVHRMIDILKSVRSLEISYSSGVNLRPVELQTIFSSLEEQFQPSLLKKNLTLFCSNKLPDNVYAMADAQSLNVNVLGNLISNAIKFSYAGSTIILETILKGDKIIISVKDFGIGMTEINRQKIFRDKIQSSSRGTNGELGTGFGLSIVHNYVSLYGGTIEVHSNIPSGSIFTIELDAYLPQNMASGNVNFVSSSIH